MNKRPIKPFRERVEEIVTTWGQYESSHDIKDTVTAICQAVVELVGECLPENKQPDEPDLPAVTYAYIQAYNQAIKDMRNRLKEKLKPINVGREI